MTSRRKIGLGLAAALVVLLGFPREVEVAPRWRVVVRDQIGRPVAGVRVNEIWAHYDFESVSHEENRLTDSSGFVDFQPRTTRTCAGAQVLARILKVAMLNVHASYGPSASVGIHHKMPNGRDLLIIPAPRGSVATTEVTVAPEVTEVGGSK